MNMHRSNSRGSPPVASRFRATQNEPDYGFTHSGGGWIVSAGRSPAFIRPDPASREIAFMGLPQIVIKIADNQAGNVRELAARAAAMESSFRGEEGIAELSRKIRELAGNPLLRKHFREAGRKLVDGQGARRVVRALKSHA